MAKSGGGLIRWKFVIPLLVIVGVLVAFFVFFFDSLLERGIEKVGGSVNGAKVEVDGLKTKFFQGRLEIARLQVANAKQPMENVVETGKLAFQMNPSELVRKRVIINDATFAGLGFGTPRKTSGALPRVEKAQEAEEPSAAAKLAEKYQNRFKVNLEGLKKDAKAKIEFDPKDLQIVKQGDALKERASTLPNRWEARVEGLKVEERLKKAEADINEIKNTKTSGAEALTSVPQALKKLQQVKADLAQLNTDVQTVRREFTTETGEIRSGVRNLPEARKQDMADILGRLNLDFADPQRLVEGIVGPAVLTRFQTMMSYVQRAQKYMPSKIEKASLPPRPRAEGMNIEFPTPAAPPKFWLQHAALSGAFQGIAAAGELKHATSDPGLVGKPLTLDLKGGRDAQRFTANAVIDHTTDKKNDRFALEAFGLPLAGLVSEGPFGQALQAGTGDMKLAVSVAGGSEIGGQIDLNMRGLKLDPALLLGATADPQAATAAAPPSGDVVKDAKAAFQGDALKATFATNLTRAIETMPAVLVSAKLSGTWTDPSIALSSNLTSAFADVVKKTTGEIIGRQKEQLEAQLDGLVKTKTNEVNERLSAAEAKLNQKLNEAQAKVEGQIREATGINLGGGDGKSSIPGVKIPDLKGIFKKK